MIPFAEIVSTIQSLPIPDAARHNPLYLKKAALYCAILAVGMSVPKLQAYTGYEKRDIFDLTDYLQRDGLLSTGTLGESYVRGFVKGGDGLIDLIVGKSSPSPPAVIKQEASMTKTSIVNKLIAAQTGRFDLAALRDAYLAKSGDAPGSGSAVISYALKQAVKRGQIHVVQTRRAFQGGNIYAPGTDASGSNGTISTTPGAGTDVSGTHAGGTKRVPKTLPPPKPTSVPIIVAAGPSVELPTGTANGGGRAEFVLQWQQGENRVELKASIGLSLTDALTAVSSLTNSSAAG